MTIRNGITNGISILTIAVLLLMAPPTRASLVSEEGHAQYYTALDEGLKIASETKRPVLIKFFTDWCKWCKVLDTVVFVDPVAIKYFTDEVVLIKINAEVDTLVAQKYKVSGYPTNVLVNANGEEVDRIIGYAPTEEFLGILNDYQKGIGTLASLLTKAEGNIDRALYLEIADKYKFRGGSEEAVMWFEKVISNGETSDSLSGVAKTSHANMLYRAKEYEKSMKMYEQIKKEFGPNQFGEQSDIYCAIIFKKMDDKEAAINAFEQFKKDYPESEDFEYATEQIAKLTEALSAGPEGSSN